MRNRTKILVVDDHPVVRKGIGFCLAQHGHLLIVGEAADGFEAVAKARALLPDIVLLDLDLPLMSGLVRPTARTRCKIGGWEWDRISGTEPAARRRNKGFQRIS